MMRKRRSVESVTQLPSQPKTAIAPVFLPRRGGIIIIRVETIRERLRDSLLARHVLNSGEPGPYDLCVDSLCVDAMPIPIETVLRRGINRTVARNGLLLVAVLYVVSTVNAIVGLGVQRWITTRGVLPMDVPFSRGMDAGVSREVGTALFAIPPAVGAVVSLLAGVATIVLTIGALRTFVSDETERLPSEHFTQNMVWPGLNFLIGTIVFGVLVALGFVFLIVPGVFLLVALAFWTVYVSVEDENFVEAMQDSWGLTRGHRVRLFLLGVAVAVIAIVVSALFGVAGVVGGVIGIVIVQIGSALTTVFTLATLAAAYEQLVTLPTEESTVTTDTGTATSA